MAAVVARRSGCREGRCGQGGSCNGRRICQKTFVASLRFPVGVRSPLSLLANPPLVQSYCCRTRSNSFNLLSSAGVSLANFSH